MYKSRSLHRGEKPLRRRENQALEWVASPTETPGEPPQLMSGRTLRHKKSHTQVLTISPRRTNTPRRVL